MGLRRNQRGRNEEVDNLARLGAASPFKGLFWGDKSQVPRRGVQEIRGTQLSSGSPTRTIQTKM